MIKFSSYYKIMMRNILLFFTVLTLFSIISSCKKPPVYPNAPQIELKEVTKFPGDSIKFTISFKDGDGDLGLSSDDTEPPFQLFDFILDNGNKIFFDATNPELPPLNCHNYQDHDQNGLPIFKDTLDKVPDFARIEENPNYFNYFVDILVQQTDGTFQLLDVTNDVNCKFFNDRFFRLSTSEGPINGTLNYQLEDLSFSQISGETVKFRISIQDRSLNRSNTVETSPIIIN